MKPVKFAACRIATRRQYFEGYNRHPIIRITSTVYAAKQCDVSLRQCKLSILQLCLDPARLGFSTSSLFQLALHLVDIL